MSERGFFSQRNLIPGAVFLIVVLVYNSTETVSLLSGESSQIGALVVALIGSPAVGYLISQLWWWHFQSKGKFSTWASAKKMCEIYGISEKDPSKIGVIYDYILHGGIHSDKKKEGLSTYAFRRYDNYVLLKTTKYALICAGFLGVFSSSILLIQNTGISIGLLSLSGTWVIITSSIILVILILAIDSGAESVKKEYDEIHKAIIIDSYSEKSVEHLKNVFPGYIFSDIKKNKIEQGVSYAV